MPEETKTHKWMQKVLEEHRQLEASIAALRTFLEQPRPGISEESARDWSAQLSRDLVELHHLLVRHFRYEEDGGMMTDLSEKHPRADRWVDDLVEEHRELLHDIRSITEAVMFYEEGRQPENPAIRRRLNDLFDRLYKHDQTETQLIQRLAYEELGSGE
jgi:hypothetical protein